MIKPCALIILDGFGYSKQMHGNAIAHAHMACYSYLLDTYPHTLLAASGTAVGLPEGYMGNSEAGHLAIGAGQSIEQPITTLLQLIDTNAFATQPAVQASFAHAKAQNGRIHLLGLLSDAGVHCHYKIIAAYANAACEQGLQVYLHLFSDGRDMLAQTFLELLDRFRQLLLPGISIASVVGRFYAMDRDNNYDRTAVAYSVLTRPDTNRKTISLEKAIQHAYQEGYTDQNMPPIQLDPTGCIHENDTVVFVNVRPERTQQLTAALKGELEGEPYVPCTLFQPVAFDSTHEGPTIIQTPKPNCSLRQILAEHNKTTALLAETEKAVHVTQFLGGSGDDIFSNERFLIVPSIVTPSYADYPRMSADTITYFVRTSLREAPQDMYIINYANADMVGHTGNFQATIWACECLDDQLHYLYTEIVKKRSGTLIIVGDHGNAEQMIDPKKNEPDPRHTTNPVPLICTTKDAQIAQYVHQATGLAEVLGIVRAVIGLD